jgi:hypothetical protein
VHIAGSNTRSCGASLFDPGQALAETPQGGLGHPDDRRGQVTKAHGFFHRSFNGCTQIPLLYFRLRTFLWELEQVSSARFIIATLLHVCDWASIFGRSSFLEIHSKVLRR